MYSAAVYSVARFGRKTKRERRRGTTTIPIDAWQNANHASGFSRFSWSVDSREEDKTVEKREREREEERGGRREEEVEADGVCQADAISRNNRCTHIVATLARYCFTLQNIAFYLRAAASHELKTRPRNTAASSYSSYVEERIRRDRILFFFFFLFEIFSLPSGGETNFKKCYLRFSSVCSGMVWRKVTRW